MTPDGKQQYKGGGKMPKNMQDLIEKYVNEIKKIYGSHLRKVILHISVKQHGRPGRTACHSAFNGVGR